MYPRVVRRVKLSAAGRGTALGTEARLVLCCARTELSAAAAAHAARLLAQPIDAARVTALAREQAVLPLVSRRLGTDLRADAPPQLQQALAEEARRLAADSLALAGVLLELLDAFDRVGIGTLPFKGPTLALQAYGDVGLRTFADLDLLVRPADLRAARVLLLEVGFAPCWPSSAARRALLVRRGSHETFERGGAVVELHWRVASPVSDFALDYDRLWRRLTSVRLGERDVPALRPEDLLLVLTLHGTKHAWERLAWICDVAELLRAQPALDWDALLRESERMHCTRALHLALALADELLEAPLPEGIRRRVGADRSLRGLVAHVRGRLFLPPRAGAGTFAFHLGTRPGLGAKLALALGSLTALNQRDLELIALPDAALPLYFLTRPARLAGKALAHAVRGPRRR